MGASSARERSTNCVSAPDDRRATWKRSSLRSPNGWVWWRLIDKERRELAASRGWIVVLVLLGPLVGHAFITAVDAYAEASGGGGGPAGPGAGFDPTRGPVVTPFR